MRLLVLEEIDNLFNILNNIKPKNYITGDNKYLIWMNDTDDTVYYLKIKDILINYWENISRLDNLDNKEIDLLLSVYDDNNINTILSNLSIKESLLNFQVNNYEYIELENIDIKYNLLSFRDINYTITNIYYSNDRLYIYLGDNINYLIIYDILDEEYINVIKLSFLDTTMIYKTDMVFMDNNMNDYVYFYCCSGTYMYIYNLTDYPKTIKNANDVIDVKELVFEYNIKFRDWHIHNYVNIYLSKNGNLDILLLNKRYKTIYLFKNNIYGKNKEFKVRSNDIKEVLNINNFLIKINYNYCDDKFIVLFYDNYDMIIINKNTLDIKVIRLLIKVYSNNINRKYKKLLKGVNNNRRNFFDLINDCDFYPVSYKKIKNSSNWFLKICKYNNSLQLYNKVNSISIYNEHVITVSNDYILINSLDYDLILVNILQSVMNNIKYLNIKDKIKLAHFLNVNIDNIILIKNKINTDLCDDIKMNIMKYSYLYEWL